MNLQVEFHELVDGHNSSLVTASVAVVRRTEHSHDITVMSPVVTLHDKLMSTGDPGQVIRVIELFWNILTEAVSSTSGWDTPAASIIGVRPEQVAHGTFLGHLLNSIELSDLIEGVDARWKTSVQAENLILDHCGQWQVVKELCEDFPYVGISVLSEALVVETISITIISTTNQLTLGWFICSRGYLWG